MPDTISELENYAMSHRTKKTNKHRNHQSSIFKISFAFPLNKTNL